MVDSKPVSMGYYAVVCKGFQDATGTIKKYMAGELLVTDKKEKAL